MFLKENYAWNNIPAVTHWCVRCQESSTARHLTQDSCVFARQTLSLMFRDTLSTWPIFVFFRAKSPHCQRYRITWLDVSALFLSFLISIHVFSSVPYTQKLLWCSPVCFERSSSVCWKLTHKAKHSSWELLPSHLFPPFLPPHCSGRLSDLFLNVPVRDFYHI